MRSGSCTFPPHLVDPLGVLSDKGSIEHLALVGGDHNQLPHFRRTAAQAIMTLEEEAGREGQVERRHR